MTVSRRGWSRISARRCLFPQHAGVARAAETTGSGSGTGGLGGLRAAVPGEGPGGGFALAVSWTVGWLAFLQRCPMVLGVAEVGVGAVGEQPPDAGWPAVACRGVQGQPLPFGVGLVDRRSRLDELIDDVQPLVVSGEPARCGWGYRRRVQRPLRCRLRRRSAPWRPRRRRSWPR